MTTATPRMTTPDPIEDLHSHFNQPREEMTARIVRAVRHPAVTMLGHATGRLLLRRESYAVDLEAVLRAAAESGTLIEINAHPNRLEAIGVAIHGQSFAEQAVAEDLSKAYPPPVSGLFKVTASGNSWRPSA